MGSHVFISTGSRPTPSLIYPPLGSVTTKELPRRHDIPPYISTPKTDWNPGYLGDAYAPFNTNAVPRPGEPFQVRGIKLAEGVTIDMVKRRERLLEKIDRRFREGC